MEHDFLILKYNNPLLEIPYLWIMGRFLDGLKVENILVKLSLIDRLIQGV